MMSWQINFGPSREPVGNLEVQSILRRSIKYIVDREPPDLLKRGGHQIEWFS